jgi:nucleoside-triphosphatase THEP1
MEYPIKIEITGPVGSGKGIVKLILLDALFRYGLAVKSDAGEFLILSEEVTLGNGKAKPVSIA